MHSVGDVAFCLPHARGGVSSRVRCPVSACRSSPRPWGCFRRHLSRTPSRSVFPTPVGVFLRLQSAVRAQQGLPHARGGVSNPWREVKKGDLSSPRPWGCFPACPIKAPTSTVFPTPVGVFPDGDKLVINIRGLPHARGGVSVIVCAFIQDFPSSPRPWGCFRGCLDGRSTAAVFPTPVGVFLSVE